MPGVLNSMAGTAPPTVAPFITPMRKPRIGSSASSEWPKNEISTGSESAIAKGPFSPGVAPITMPRTSPPRTIAAGSQSKAPSAVKNTSVIPRMTYSRTSSTAVYWSALGGSSTLVSATSKSSTAHTSTIATVTRARRRSRPSE